MDPSSLVAIFVVVALVVIALFVFFSFVPVMLWISALASGVRISMITLVAMRLRRVVPSRIVNPLIKATKAGLGLTINQLESHYLAGGNVDRVVNALIRQYGKPAEIAIELARDLKLSREERRRVEEKIKENTERNEALRKELVALGQKVNRENLQRLKLYHELPPQQRCCIYTGKPISVEMLFSDEVVIDHILPFKDTLDDSLANKVL